MAEVEVVWYDHEVSHVKVWAHAPTRIGGNYELAAKERSDVPDPVVVERPVAFKVVDSASKC